MPHIALHPELPGMRALQTFRPETAEPLNALANLLLRGPSTLSPGERELIGTVVSARNECVYCQSIHGAVAAQYLGSEDVVERAKFHAEETPLSPKMKALLAIAVEVQEGGRAVRTESVERARAQGASDLEIHDTVLIAAAFCMFNRYVDGLATFAPADPDFYRQRASWIIDNGYSSGRPAVAASS